MLLLITMALSLLPNSMSIIHTASADAETCEGTVGGTWSADEWCEIDAPGELDKIRTNADTLAGRYRLTAHLDLSAYGNWERIGDYSSPFAGVFDGNGFTISNLTIHTTANYVGFFGYTYGATIQNVRLTGINVTGVSYVGGLVGHAVDKSGVGTNIINSSAEGVVTGEQTVGVLVGYNGTSAIIDSYSHGEVSVADNPGNSFGGLVGYNTGTITGSFTTAKVGAGDLSGGLVGDNFHDHMPPSESYWNRDTSGVGVSDGGIESNTEYMKLKATYTDHPSTGHVAWDFASSNPTWGMVQRVTYPLHYGDYKKVALRSLEVEDASAGGSPLVWDRAFAEDYGVYTLRSVNKTSTLEISADALDEDSDIAFYSGSALDTPIPDADGDHAVAVPLAEGENDFGIQVIGDNGLEAMYRLKVIRDSGESDNPHRIATADDLAAIGQDVGYELDDHYVLEADIDLAGYGSGEGWLPIGSDAEPFAGSFEGNQHTIRNLTIDRPGQSEVGLFGAAAHAYIANVSLLGVNVQGDERVGALVGNALSNAGGDTLSASRIIVQGTVSGNAKVGGLIGAASSILDIDESYSAAFVEGSAAGGLVGSHTGSGAISAASFWDVGASGQPSSQGGGNGRTTAEMLTRETYVDAGWTFGAGGWGMIEDMTYPMFYDRVQGVWLNNLAVTIAGSNKPLAFDRNVGLYELELDAPAPEATVSVVTNDAGATVEIGGQAGVSGTVDLDFGVNNIIDMQVTGPDGSQGVYRLAITVPVPKPIAVHVPADGTYGIGDELKFTLTYDYDVVADGGNLPALPILWDGGEDLAAFSGQPIGEPDKLAFSYTVREGDAMAGIELGDSLVAESAGSVVGADDTAAASMELPDTIPATSGITIDGIKPGITLTPSTTSSTRNPVTVTVDADGTGSAIDELKLADGIRDALYFADLGTEISDHEFTVNENGNYTVYAKDRAGNERVETIGIANIVTTNPSILLDYTPKTVTRASVEVSVTASVYEAAGNKLEAIRWAEGELAADDFNADPTLGADVVTGGSFSVSANGPYSVYAIDSAGNEQVETIEIKNIDSSVPIINVGNPNVRQFYIDPNRDNTVSFDGLTLFVPAGAVEQSTYITVETVTDATRKLMKEGQKLLGKAYKLTKNTQGNFKLPITLSMEWTGEELGNDKRPVVAYYDEDAKQWIALKGSPKGSQLAGETDHFTVFAAIAVDAEPESPPALSDITAHWAEKWIREGVASGLVDGYPDGTFRPDGQVTRAEFATMLHRMLAWPAGSDMSFVDQSDIRPWARDAVSAAVKAGVVGGYPDGTFRPGADVSRAEAAAMIAKAAGLQASRAAATAFADDSVIADWAKPYINAALEAELVQGQSGNRFNPQAAMTRAEAVVLLLRLEDYLN